MPTDITVTLSDAQVAEALDIARLLFPDRTAGELRADLEASALYGPGIRRTLIGWAREHYDRQASEARDARVEAFAALFPPPPAAE